mmetsp:Transcript_52699/g.111968  ORF Transcript_52699/g.111968 Transcript_52699/m.111968 type:complete len:221 (-) Transcript_52699:795-1457(-)
MTLEEVDGRVVDSSDEAGVDYPILPSRVVRPAIHPLRGAVGTADAHLVDRYRVTLSHAGGRDVLAGCDKDLDAIPAYKAVEGGEPLFILWHGQREVVAGFSVLGSGVGGKGGGEGLGFKGREAIHGRLELVLVTWRVIEGAAGGLGRRLVVRGLLLHGIDIALVLLEKAVQALALRCLYLALEKIVTSGHALSYPAAKRVGEAERRRNMYLLLLSVELLL